MDGMIGLSFKGKPEDVSKIDCIVLAKRRENPSENYSRAAFVRDAVTRALAEYDVEPPTVRARTRERVRATAA
jgi:hypothetical protein